MVFHVAGCLYLSGTNAELPAFMRIPRGSRSVVA